MLSRDLFQIRHGIHIRDSSNRLKYVFLFIEIPFNLLSFQKKKILCRYERFLFRFVSLWNVDIYMYIVIITDGFLGGELNIFDSFLLVSYTFYPMNFHYLLNLRSWPFPCRWKTIRSYQWRLFSLTTKLSLKLIACRFCLDKRKPSVILARKWLYNVLNYHCSV